MANKHYLAQVTLETTTPLKVGSGESDFFTDMPVQKDVNNLPIILGTSIAGALRDKYREIEKNNDDLFGFQDNRTNTGAGSRVIISNALLCDKDGSVVEGIGFDSKFLDKYLTLPLREHTAITDKGIALEHAKFDEEVVFSGSKFKFELEFIADKDFSQEWETLLHILKDETFRLGAGTTKGFGSFNNVKILEKRLDLDKEEELELYINKSSSLNEKNFHWKPFTKTENLSNSYTKYTLKIEPENFFLFGSGFGDNEADMTPVSEKTVMWKDGKGDFTKKKVLIPASSIKGAIAHRTAFHYNKHQLQNNQDHTKVGEENDAVKAIFGHKKEKIKNQEIGSKGKILISDCFKQKGFQTKTFDHVSIDRFTGGTIDGALFQETTVAKDDEIYTIKIWLHNDIEEENYVKAFEASLADIKNGMLPLGGMTTKGHGVFSGTLEKNGKAL